MKLLKTFIIGCVLLFNCYISTGQGHSLGTWNLVNVKWQFAEKWSLISEAQIRSFHFYDHFYYYEYKTGIQYNLDKNFSVLLGIGNYDTYTPGGNFKTPMINDETRLWEQVTMNQSISRVKFEHRFRAEQRFTYAGYRNRFRYRLGIIVPLNKKTVENHALFTYVYDELFFTDNAPYFERNRLSGGAGYKFNKTFTFQAGFLNQFDYKINNELSQNYLQISLLFDIRKELHLHDHPRGALD